MSDTEAEDAYESFLADSFINETLHDDSDLETDNNAIMPYTFRKSDLPMLNLDVDSLKDFTIWKTKWEDYRILSSLADEAGAAQARVLRACMEGSTLHIVENLGIPEADRTNQEVIVNRIQQHIEGTINPVAQRNKFFKRMQHRGETVADYVVQLRDLASRCRYADNFIEEAIRDQLVLGLRDQDTVERLLEHRDLTLQRAIEIAESIQQAKADKSFIRGDAAAVNLQRGQQSHKSKQKSSGQPSKQKPKDGLNCQYCGGSHGQGKCPASGTTCGKCGKQNHFAKVCRSGQSSKPKSKGSNNIRSKISTINMTSRVNNSVSKIARTKKTWPEVDEIIDECPTVKITCHARNGRAARIEILPDSGADVNVFPLSVLRKLSMKKTDLQTTKVTSSGYGESPIKIHGQTEMCFEYECNGKKREAAERVYITDRGASCLSWKTCKKLGIIQPNFPNMFDASSSIQALEGNSSDSKEKTPQHDNKRKTAAGPLTKEGLIAEFPSVFDGVIRTMPGEKYKIELVTDAQPFCVNAPRTIPLPLQDKLKAELELLESQGIIKRQQKPTAWCAPIVIAPKKNSEKIRMCVDFTRLNKFVVRERYMSNTPAEAVLSIRDANFFSVFDAVKGYHQCELDEKSQDLTTFITPFGRFKYLRAPYGVSSISEHYNRRMDECLSGITNLAKIVDDCAVYSRTEEEHRAKVREFLKKCEEKRISLNAEKMQVCKKTVRFGGFDLSPDGYSMSDDITQAIRDFPTPGSIKTLRGYFGLVNQLAASNKDVAQCLEPLRALLKTKNDFIWTETHEEAFNKSKQKLVSTIKLAYYDVSKKTRLCTDASRTGLGFVLQQQHDDDWRTVQTGSRFLTDAESRYAVIELEMLGVAWAIHKCKYFLCGMPCFEIITDHNPLVPILNSHRLDEIENPRLQRLRTRIMGYNFFAKHIKGKDNDAPDALSRYPSTKPAMNDELAELDAFSDDAAPTSRETRVQIIALEEQEDNGNDLNEQPEENLRITELREYADRDQSYADLKDIIKNGFPDTRNQLPVNLRIYWRSKEHFSLEDDLILHGVRLLIPERLRLTMLARMHAAHQGIIRMRARARLAVYWPNIDNDIEDYVNACQHCQDRKPQQPSEPLIQKKRPERPFQELAVDYAEKEGNIFLIMVDCKTDWPTIIFCGKDMTSRKLIDILREEFCRTAVPDVIWSDQGTQFMSQQFQDFLRDWGIRHKTSSPRNPQSNGKVEATVKSMKNMITSAIKVRRIDQDKIYKSLIQYRNTPSQRDGLSPAQKLFGHPIQDDLPIHRTAFLKKHQKAFERATEKAQRHDEKQAERFNQHARELPDLHIGQPVAIYDGITSTWKIYGTIVECQAKRRYKVKTTAGTILCRNRKFLRVRHPFSVNRGEDNPAPAAGPPPPAPPAAAPAQGAAAQNETPRRSSRARKKPQRLIEDTNWH